MDWNQTRDFPAAEDKKTFVKNFLKVNVCPLTDRFSFVQIMLWFGSVDKESGNKNKTWDLVVEEIMWNSEKVADLSTLSFSSLVAHWPFKHTGFWSDELFPGGEEQELCICQQADSSPLSVSQWNYWIIVSMCVCVCVCVQTDQLTFVQCKVKSIFAVAAGSELLAIFKETLCHMSHMLHFMSSQICGYSK